MSNGSFKDDFWDLSKYSKQQPRSTANTPPSFAPHRTSAVEISDTRPNAEKKLIDESETMITKFVPPHSGASFSKKHVIREYEPQNPLIKSVTIYSDREGDEIFIGDNLFIRERRALLDREVTFKEYVPFYSYAPRYSQLNKSQLNYYLWWRQNARNGIFTKTDESYVMLYAYELAACSDKEDTRAAAEMLCKLLTSFSNAELNLAYKVMIRDILVDFCLIHAIPSPLSKLGEVERQVLFGSFLPEFFTDLSQSRDDCMPVIASLSLYDYRRSKSYSDSTKEAFDKGVAGALSAVMNNDEAFSSITSFTKGMYGSISRERHPFNRMVNIVNKNVKLEIVYYSIENLKATITDIVRYSENKIREHLGVRSRINVMTVNASARTAIDSFFEYNMPAQQFVDKRRKDSKPKAPEVHEYDKLYEVPKADISPERALMIERESWETTKKLTEAFADEVAEITAPVAEPIQKEEPAPEITVSPPPTDNPDSLYSQLYASLGAVAEFVNLCRGSSLLEQRNFASAHGTTPDELADKINESAVELFGDIILEDSGSGYAIIEDYLFLFN